MKIVGLTGGIGSGKTTVAQMFNKLGVPIYIADLEAKKLMNSSKVIKRKLKQLFGEKAYVNNELNRPYLSDQIFNKKDLLLKMNDIVHPKVGTHFKKWISKQNAPYIIKEVAILFENGSYLKCDFVITVTATEEDKIQRVIQRDNFSAEKVKTIMNNQWDDEERVNLSHFVIENNDLLDTERQVEKTHEEILRQISKI